MLFSFETGKGQICTELLSNAALGQIQNVFAFLIGQLLCSFEIDLQSSQSWSGEPSILSCSSSPEVSIIPPTCAIHQGSVRCLTLISPQFGFNWFWHQLNLMILIPAHSDIDTSSFWLTDFDTCSFKVFVVSFTDFCTGPLAAFAGLELEEAFYGMTIDQVTSDSCFGWRSF